MEWIFKFQIKKMVNGIGPDIFFDSTLGQIFQKSAPQTKK
jgi:hypothetical protein